MLDVEDRLIEQLGDVGIVEPVDDLFAPPLADHKAEMPKLSQLMRHGRRLHAHGVRELADRADPILQSPEDLHPTGRRQNPHPLGDHPRGLSVNRASMSFFVNTVTHPNT